MPNYKDILISNGVLLQENSDQAYFGATAIINDDLNGIISANPKIGSPAYLAGLDKGDVLTSINNKPFPNGQYFDVFIKSRIVGDSIQIDFDRYGVKKSTLVLLKSDTSYNIVLLDKEGEERKLFCKGSPGTPKNVPHESKPLYVRTRKQGIYQKDRRQPQNRL